MYIQYKDWFIAQFLAIKLIYNYLFLVEATPLAALLSDRLLELECRTNTGQVDMY